MNIPDMKHREKTDLERFLEFADNLESRRVEVVKEDWGNQCAISIIEKRSLSIKYAIFGFENDGSFRGLYTHEEPIENVPTNSVFRSLLNKLTWR